MNPGSNEYATRAAFASARRLEPTDAEVERVLARLGSGARRVTPRSRVVALVLAACLAAVGAAGAATGLLDIGSRLPALPRVAGDGEPRYSSGRVVVATGELPDAGRWQMSVTGSDQGRCLAFERPDSSHDSAPQEVCGLPSFDAISHGGGSELPDTTVVFGPAPERASAIRVSAPSGFHLTAPTHDGLDGVDGDFYVLEIPRRGLVNARVSWLDEDSRPYGSGLVIPSTVRYGPGPSKPQPPH